MTKKSKTESAATFVFRKHDSIGYADAVQDKQFLEECFIPRSELDILVDVGRPECVLVGRTGTGKTAILQKLNTSQERVMIIYPEDLALAYLSDNSIIAFFHELGVKMDLFYRLLWRHIFAVELIRKHYGITDEQTRNTFVVKLKEKIARNKTKQQAVDYLIHWGESFWEDTGHRIKEVTVTVEDKLKKSVDGKLATALPGITKGSVEVNREAAKTLTTEEKEEIVQIGQSVVNSVQINLLSEIIKLLDEEILEDKQKRYYILVDDLDKNWADDPLKSDLIRALVETIRDFNDRITNAKIIVAVREDLLELVFQPPYQPGYQAEKYADLILHMTWNTEELVEMMDCRVDALIRPQYTKQKVHLSQLLPKKVKNLTGENYFFRTIVPRPRDAILFFNECIKAAEGKPRISKAGLKSATAAYSEQRLKSLSQEWVLHFPYLDEVCNG